MFQVLCDWPSAPGWFDPTRESSGSFEPLLSVQHWSRLSLNMQVNLMSFSWHPLLPSQF